LPSASVASWLAASLAVRESSKLRRFFPRHVAAIVGFDFWGNAEPLNR